MITNSIGEEVDCDSFKKMAFFAQTNTTIRVRSSATKVILYSTIQ